MENDVWVMFMVRMSSCMVQQLYKQADKKYKGKVNELTNQIINEYIDIHKDDRLLTSYIGENKGKGKDYADPCHLYSLQLRSSTLCRLRDMASDFCEPVGRIAKTAFKIWWIER